MNIPITEKEFNDVLDLLNRSGDKFKPLYNKLWTYKINCLNREKKNGLS